VGKKTKFSLAESRLEKCLERLRKSNQDFGTLVDQTAKLNNMHQTSTALTTPAPVSQKVKEFMQVQKASGPLHRALEMACGIHEDHSAYFRMDSSVNVSTTESTIIHFNMAFTSGPGSQSNGLEPVWIAVWIRH
jgi:uncharacterized protein YhdP